MKLIIHILLLFIIVNSILKLSFWKWWHALLFSVGAAAFVVWTKQFAIMQSKTQLHDFMMNADMLKNVAVIITIESAINLVYSFTALSNQFGKNKKRKLMLLRWYLGFSFPCTVLSFNSGNIHIPGSKFRHPDFSACNGNSSCNSTFTERFEVSYPGIRIQIGNTFFSNPFCGVYWTVNYRKRSCNLCSYKARI